MRQSPVKMPQCRLPGSTGTQFGWVRTASVKASATSMGVGCLNTLGLVTIRRKPLRTRSATPYGSSPASRPRSQPAYSWCRAASGRGAYTRTLTSTSRIASRCVVTLHEVEQGRAVVQIHPWLDAALAEGGQLDGLAGGLAATA